MAMSIIDITKLDTISDSIKDEMMIATMHGIDIEDIARKYRKEPERVRELRLLIQTTGKNNASKYKTYHNLPISILRMIRYYIEDKKDVFSYLDRYITKNSKLNISEETLEKILKANLKVPNKHIDFTKVENDIVDTILYGLKRGIEVEDIIDYSRGKRAEVVNLLVTLRTADINIEPFLNDIWTEDRIFALIQGRLVIEPEVLIQEYNITSAFTAGELTEVIRAHKISPDLASLIAYTEDDIPIYNQYQMFEIIEGVRLGLDITNYYQPENTDLVMRSRREVLMKDKAKEKGRQFRENLVRKLDSNKKHSISTDWYNL